MTQQEFVKKESEKYYGVKVEGKTFHFDDGLTKGLEIAKEFADWKEKESWQHEYREQRNHTTDELLTIFLNEKYGK